MLWVWLLEAVDLVAGWVVSWFPDWTIPYPAALTLVIPVPLGLAGESLNTWLTWSLLVSAALIVGRGLYWLYRIIPTNG